MTQAAGKLAGPRRQDPRSRTVVGTRVDATSYGDAARTILEWGRQRRSAYVCVANVDSVVRAHDDHDFGRILGDADLVTPDGMPLVWALQQFGVPTATRVYGPDLTLRICAEAASAGLPVAFFGGTETALAGMTRRLRGLNPSLEIAYAWSPPFRDLTADEDTAVVEAINASGPAVVFVGLGCPKQERWMAQHRGRIRAPMVGVGAAFDFISGEKAQAPAMLQRLGLEWLFRLVHEPRRLWRRYLVGNSRFLGLFAMQFVRWRRESREAL